MNYCIKFKFRATTLVFLATVVLSVTLLSPSSLPSRLHQAAKLYLYSPSSGLYSCPLAMTDGAAKLIEVSFY
jgi:hypothetical protein